MIRIGIVGLGAAGRAFVPALRAHPDFELVAVADPLTEARDSLARSDGIAAYDDLPAMLAGTSLDAVYVATPTDLHPGHVQEAFDAGKHVLVEKPMAVDLDQGRAMVEAAQQARLVLAVGHSHSYDLPIRRMHEVIASGSLGPVRMINTWCFTDWIYRPRRPEELVSELGGGVTFRQGSHQFDIIRLLGGGLVKSVRATVFDWDPMRPAVGAHIVYLQFEDGAAATAVYNGYGHLSSVELCDGVTEWGFREEPGVSRVPRRRAVSPEEELRRKRERAKDAIPASAPLQPHFGLTVVNCERGDIRQSPGGLYVYDGSGREEILLPTDRTPRDFVLAEFADAITGVRPCVHDGRWGLANLELCLAALASSRSGEEIRLGYQVGVAEASRVGASVAR